MGCSRTYSFFSCLRTILKFLYQSRKFVPDSLSFSRTDRNDRVLFVFVVMVIYIQRNKSRVSIMSLKKYLIRSFIKYYSHYFNQINDPHHRLGKPHHMYFSSGPKSIFHLVLSQLWLITQNSVI